MGASTGVAHLCRVLYTDIAPFIYSEQNKKQKLAARQQKSLIQPPGNPTGAASVYLVGIPLLSEKQLAMVRELLFPSVPGD